MQNNSALISLSPLGGEGGTAASPTFIRIRWLCHLKVGFSTEKPSRFVSIGFHI